MTETTKKIARTMGDIDESIFQKMSASMQKNYDVIIKWLREYKEK